MKDYCTVSEKSWCLDKLEEKCEFAVKLIIYTDA